MIVMVEKRLAEIEGKDNSNTRFPDNLDLIVVKRNFQPQDVIF